MKCAACLSLKPFLASDRGGEGERISLSLSLFVGKEKRDNIAYLKERERSVQRLVNRIYWWVDDSGTISSISLHRRTVFDILSRLHLFSLVYVFIQHCTYTYYSSTKNIRNHQTKQEDNLFFLFRYIYILTPILLFVFGRLFDISIYIYYKKQKYKMITASNLIEPARFK
jgi:uncharacterized membrane protein